MTGSGDEFSLVPQWLKSSHGLQSPGAGSHSAGQQRDAWHHGRGSTSINPAARTAAEPALRPATLSAAAAAPSSASAHAIGGNSGSSGGGSSTSLSRGVDRDRDRVDRSERPDRDRAAHGPWSHFHTSSRSGRTGPYGGRESASGHIGSVDADRFHTLGSPFKHGSSAGSSSSSRHGLQRSVSDSGGTVSGAADAVHSGFGASHQQRDSRHHLAPSHSSGRQGQRDGLGVGGAVGSAQYGGHNSGDDKLGWRDSNPRQQLGQHGLAGGAGSSRVSNKPPPLTATDFPSLTGANSMAGSSPRSSSSNDRIGSPQPYAPSVAPYKQDFLTSRGSLGWTSKLADVPGTPAAAAAAGGGGGGGVSTAAAGGGAAAGSGARGSPGGPAAAAGEAGEAGSIGGSSSSSGHEQQRFGGSSSSRSNSADGGADGAAAGDSRTGDGRTAAVCHRCVAASVGASGTMQSSLITGAPTGGAMGSGSTHSAGVSLADTLKQAVAASNAASNGSSAAAAAARLEAQRRQSKALVPLLPGSKAKHGAGNGSGAARRLTPALATAAAAAAAAGSNGSSSAAAAKLLSPTSPGPLLTLGLHSHVGSGATAAAAGGNGSNGNGTSSARTDPSEAARAGDAAGSTAGGSGLGSNGMLFPVSPGGAVAAAAVGAGQAGGSEGSGGPHKAAAGVTALMGPHSSSHQQHLADRHSFFAVLKRKSSTTHQTGSSSSKAAGSEGAPASSGGACAEPGSGTAPAAAADSALAQQQTCSNSNGVQGSSSSSSAEVEGTAGDQGTGSSVDRQQQQQQQQQQSSAGPLSYSLADIPDTFSSSSGSDGGCDRSSVGGSSVCSSTAEHASGQQQQQRDADLAAVGSSAAHALAPEGPAAVEACAVENAAGAAIQQQQLLPKTAADTPTVPVTVTVSTHDPTNPESKVSSRDECGEDSCVSAGGWDVLDKEEEAFLRSLGWTGSDDGEGDEGSWGLTQEEIAAFQAKAAASSTQQGSGNHLHHHQQQGCGGATTPGKLAYVAGSLPGGFGGLLEGFAGLRVGQDGVGGVWSQHQSLSLPNGSGAQGVGVWGLHPYWPPEVVAARIFGGDSSSGGEESESSDSDGAN